MMKILIAITFLFICFKINGQELRNTEWVKIKAERKDGSRIVDRYGTEKEPLRYLFGDHIFGDHTVLTSFEGHNSNEQKYSITNKKLVIGDFLTYSIDTINNMNLVLTEIPNQKLEDDRINRRIFINAKFYLNYLIKTEQINIIGDTLIQCTYQFSPYFKGDIDELFLDAFATNDEINGTLIGTFVISAQGKVIGIQIDPNKNFSKKDIEKFNSTLKSTSGSWGLPSSIATVHYKINFACEFLDQNQLSRVIFLFHSKGEHHRYRGPRLRYRGLHYNANTDADDHFNRGINYHNTGKFEKAVSEFSKCLKIDCFYLDAYYNKAFSYSKLGNKTAACETWRS